MMWVASTFVVLGLAAWVAPIVSRGATQSGEPVIVFMSPEDGGYASGPMPIRVRIEPGSGIKSVSLFADGKLVCTREQPPYECQWDAGAAVVEHVVRVTVALEDGRRVARSIRTKGAEYTETVDVDVVQVTATVTAGRGRFIRGLKREAFRLYEDDVPQVVSAFSAEDAPLELVVAVDFSGSMKDAMATVKTSIKKFLAALRPADRVTILAFNNAVFTVAAPTADLATRQRAIDRLTSWGGTALYDVIVKAVTTLGKQSGRRAIVVFSDGEDLHSRIPLDTVERQLEGSDAVVYAIGQGRAPKMKELRKILERIAEKSGGRAFFEDVDKLDEVFHDIVTDLSNQYLLGYTSTNARKDDRWRELRVELPGNDYKVRARKGYRAVTR